MKKITLLLLLITPLYTFAAEKLEITQLNSGSCWIDSEESKIVSFEKNKSYTINEESIQNIVLQIESELKEYLVTLPKKLNLYLHCNSFATHLVFNFQGEKGICAWVTPEGEIDFLGNYSGKSKGLCHGAIPGRLLVHGDIPKFNYPMWEEYIEKITDSRQIILTKEYYFNEDKVIEKLKESFPNLKIERNYMFRQVGEYLMLSTSKFSH